MIKIIIADDHKIVSDGLAAMLQDPKAGLEVVAQAASGNEVLELLNKEKADLVLMDVNMPEMDGLTTARHIQQQYPRVKVLMLSMMANEKYVTQAMKAGALGYLLKTTGKQELVHAINLVVAGNQYISSQITLNLLQLEKATAESEDQILIGSALSKREMEVLQLIAKGYTNEQMADMLFMSKRTVENHRQHLLEKTGSKNTASLIVYAVKHNLLA